MRRERQRQTESETDIYIRNAYAASNTPCIRGIRCVHVCMCVRVYFFVCVCVCAAAAAVHSQRAAPPPQTAQTAARRWARSRAHHQSYHNPPTRWPRQCRLNTSPRPPPRPAASISLRRPHTRTFPTPPTPRLRVPLQRGRKKKRNAETCTRAARGI